MHSVVCRVDTHVKCGFQGRHSCIVWFLGWTFMYSLVFRVDIHV